MLTSVTEEGSPGAHPALPPSERGAAPAAARRAAACVASSEGRLGEVLRTVVELEGMVSAAEGSRSPSIRSAASSACGTFGRPWRSPLPAAPDVLRLILWCTQARGS